MSVNALVRPAMVRKGNVLVILSWGSFAWYRSTRRRVTVGELRRKIAKQVGQLLDGVVIDLDLLVTGTDIAPDPLTELNALTHPPYQNVCLDVVDIFRAPLKASVNSVGERLLRRHLSGEPFQSGIDQEMWRLIELRWPHAVFGIRTPSRAASEIALRLDFKEYPIAPPLVELWNAETRSVIEAPDWTEPFIRLASETYPQIASFATSPFCGNLLRISTAVASRMKSAESDGWDATGDLTHVLARASCCFRTSADKSIPSLLQHETNAELRASSKQCANQLT